MPKISKATATTQDFGVAVDATGDIDGYTVNFVTIRETHSLAEMLKGLPGERCSCPHWGYVSKGTLTFVYADREEVYEAGDAFYTPPGHVPSAEAGSEFVLFSPAPELAKTNAAIREYMQRQMENA